MNEDLKNKALDLLVADKAQLHFFQCLNIEQSHQMQLEQLK